tara:strand:+ start:153 stop:326 length:174 start_codon:yes stop_codon:yes gene_type:complete
MKLLMIITSIILISGCAAGGLAKTVVSTTVKVVEVPFKVIGSVIDSNEDEDNIEEDN